MSSRAKKKTKKSQQTPEVKYNLLLPYEERMELARARLKKNRAAKARRNVYRQAPLHAVRGITHRRNKHWGGASNGDICLCCLSRTGFSLAETVTKKDRSGHEWTEQIYECKCGSRSLLWVGSKARLPRRTASNAAWRKFVLEECNFLFSQVDGIPDDFLAKRSE